MLHKIEKLHLEPIVRVYFLTSSTVPNRPLRPRAEGEQVWQPENGTSRTPQLPQTAAAGSSLRKLGKIGAVLDSGCQTLHHSGKLSGVNELDLGQSN